MNTNQLAAFANDAGQAAALVSCIATIEVSRLLTIIQGSEVVLGARCDRMALCTFGCDLYPRNLFRRPHPDLAELCIVSGFCGMHDWSLHYTGPAPRYNW